MPKKVDHDERRRCIAEAVLRIAGRDGLDGARLRDVAVEAGMSLGSVQHYFASKDEMLRYVVHYLGEHVTERIMAGVRAPASASASASPVLSFLLSMASEMLPLDARRRAELRAGQAFTARAVGAPELMEYLGEGDRWLRERVAELIAQGQRDGELRAGLDPRLESVVLLAMLDGLGSELLVGLRDPEGALAAVRYHLDRLTARPAAMTTSQHSSHP
ncbi:TetR/AcrR family transcriptional regulator [Nonomuraea sp. LPB2021202275-12-8]|uniref:TetR/AcrR family transcriptional regulator n=1 Tax=Nonomuraea sp. LPB2021202275-12-8 TaxID=3120159 RepID=UPI00300CB764